MSCTNVENISSARDQSNIPLLVAKSVFISETIEFAGELDPLITELGAAAIVVGMSNNMPTMIGATVSKNHRLIVESHSICEGSTGKNPFPWCGAASILLGEIADTDTVNQNPLQVSGHLGRENFMIERTLDRIYPGRHRLDGDRFVDPRYDIRSLALYEQIRGSGHTFASKVLLAAAELINLSRSAAILTS